MTGHCVFIQGVIGGSLCVYPGCHMAGHYMFIQGVIWRVTMCLFRVSYGGTLCVYSGCRVVGHCVFIQGVM